MDLQRDVAQVKGFTTQVQPRIDSGQELAIRQRVAPIHLENLTWRRCEWLEEAPIGSV